MAAEIQIVSTLDNTQTIGGLVETEKTVVKASKSLNELRLEQSELNKKFAEANPNSKEYEEYRKGIIKVNKQIKEVSDSLIELEEVIDPIPGSLADIRQQQEKLTKAFEDADPNTDEYKKLKSELIQVSKAVKDAELSVEALDTDQVASELGGLVGGLSDVATGAVLAFGVSEESAEAFLKTLAQVEGAGRVVKGSIEGIQSGLKLYNSVLKESAAVQKAMAFASKAQAVGLSVLSAIQTAYTAIVGTSTGAMKAFKLALIGTGIGAIVVGLGLLIANFDSIVSWVGEAIDAMGGLKNILLILLGPIGLLIAAWEYLFGAEEAVDDQRKKASEENSKRTKKRIAEIKAEQKAFVEATNAETEVLEVKVKILENEGKASDDVRLKILENNKAVVQSQLDAVRQIIEAKTQQYKTEAALRGQSEEEFIKSMRAQGVDLLDLQQKANAIVDDLKLKADLSESEITKFKREQNEQRLEDAQTAADAQAKIDDDLLKRRIDAIAMLDQLEIEAIENKQEREEAILQANFEKNIAKLSDNIAEEKALILAFEQAFLSELQALKDKYAEEERNKKFEDAQRLDELRIQIIEGRRATDLEQFEIDKEVASLRFIEEIELLRFELETKELTEEEYNLRRELLEQEHQNNLSEIEKEASEARTEQALNEANKKIQTVAYFANAASSINDSFNKIQDNQLKEGEKLSLKAQKRRFQREKAFNIASALINGAGAIMNAIATFGPPPSPLGIAGIAAAGIVTAAQVAAIASQQFNPSGGSSGGSVRTPSPTISVGSGSGGTLSPGSGSGGIGLPNPTPNIPITSTGSGGSSAGEEIFNQNSTNESNVPVVKTYVISGELTTTAEAEALIEEQSTL